MNCDNPAPARGEPRMTASCSFIAIMVGLYGAFTTEVYPSSDYTIPWPDYRNDWVQRVQPLTITPFRLQYVNSKLAIAPHAASLQYLVDDLLNFIDYAYPEFNGSTIGGTGFTDPVLRSIYIPKLRDQIVTFSDESAFESYITSTSYSLNGAYTIWGGIVLNAGAPGWDYSIRMNASTVPYSGNSGVDTLQQGADFSAVQQYAQYDPVIPGPPFLKNNLDPISSQPMPGFTSLQLLVDR
jgi:hypothetical protein